MSRLKMDTPNVDLTETQAAGILGYSVRTMQRLRKVGRAPAYTKEGERKIRYARVDLDAWRMARRVRIEAAT